MQAIQIHLTVPELAERLRVTKRTVDGWRQDGRGPRWMKAGGRVLYPIAEVEVWERSSMVGAA